MVQTVKLPNGDNAQFPDDMTPQQMASVIQKQFPPASAIASPASSPQPNENVSYLKQLFNKAMDSPLVKEPIPLRLGQDVFVGLAKGGQNIANFPFEMLKKVFPTIQIPKEDFSNFAPQTESFIDKPIQELSQYAPLMATGSLGWLPETAIGAVYGATQSPQNELEGGTVGGVSNLGFGLLNKIMEANNPFVRMGARALAGAIPGYLYGGGKGALTGAAVGATAPSILTKFGLTGMEPGRELLETVQPQEALERMAAGNRLGTPLSIAEATGRSDIAANEAAYGRVGGAATDRVRMGKERILAQQKAIADLNNKISQGDNIAAFDLRKSAQDAISEMKQARTDAASPLYKIAEDQLVPMEEITKLQKSDKTIENAIQSAMSDPTYHAELQGYPKNSIKVLNYAKFSIDRQIASAKDAGHMNDARLLNQSKERLIKATDAFSPDYKAARAIHEELSPAITNIENSQLGRIANLKDPQLKQVSKMIFDPAQTNIDVLRQIKSHIQQQNPEAWDHIVKNEMSRLMLSGKNKGNTGREFFDKVLANDIRFNQFAVALEHNPEALQHLTDMKTAWQDLMNFETPRTAKGRADSGVNKQRQLIDAFVDEWNRFMGDERQIRALKYIYSPEWQKDLGRVNNISNKKAKISLMINLLGRSIIPSYFHNQGD